MELNTQHKELWVLSASDSNYKISNLGRVANVKTGLVLAPWMHRSGYEQVKLSNNRRFYVHRLVAEIWCQGYAVGFQVNHKNGVKTDNRWENLEWVSPSDNQKHKYRELGCKGSSLGMFGELHPASKAVISTCIKTGVETFYGSAMDAVRSGFTSSQISRVCRGLNGKHKGFFWRYATAADRGIELPAWVEEE